MRIIAGLAKGRRLKAPDTPATRPMTDRAREAVFSMLGPKVGGAAVLDLYAGSGSLGLEALSRGAVSAVFVENGSRALEALRSNLDGVGLGGVVVPIQTASYLAGASAGFDLVFLDPPWDLTAAEVASDLGRLDRCLNHGGTVVISRRKGDEVPTTPAGWQVAVDRRYGDTRILCYVKEQR